VKLHIVARGRIGQGSEAEIVTRYVKRMAWPTIVTELAEAAPIPPPPPRSRTVALDERGKALDTRDFADVLSKWRDGGVSEARFLIGAADGHDDATRASADLILSFGPATWPHLLLRAMLAEQLYRTTSLLAGHPYHREG
jgi:23S rRNA (pseudouridine1915-N3)-methyltransferase